MRRAPPNATPAYALRMMQLQNYKNQLKMMAISGVGHMTFLEHERFLVNLKATNNISESEHMGIIEALGRDPEIIAMQNGLSYSAIPALSAQPKPRRRAQPPPARAGMPAPTATPAVARDGLNADFDPATVSLRSLLDRDSVVLSDELFSFYKRSIQNAHTIKGLHTISQRISGIKDVLHTLLARVESSDDEGDDGDDECAAGQHAANGPAAENFDTLAHAVPVADADE
jgi:hypothetical protein